MGYDTIVAAMSGNVTQRGTFACTEKSERVKAALENGVDLCVEIPFVWACSSAQDFAAGGISVLNACGVEAVSFGAETDDVAVLIDAARETDSADGEAVRENIRKGMTYANALAETLSAEAAEILSEPNNLLAVEYIKAINRICPGTKPVAVKRTGAEHDSAEPAGMFASASYIRTLLESGRKEEACRYMPYSAGKIIAKADISDPEIADRAFLNALRNMSAGEMAQIRGVTEGLENRIADAAKNCVRFADVADAVKTKRYTLAKIRRVLVNCLAGAGKDMPCFPPYVRVLGFNSRGREVLAQIKKKTCILTKPSDYTDLPEDARKVFEAEIRATELFALTMPPSAAGRELRYTPVVAG